MLAAVRRCPLALRRLLHTETFEAASADSHSPRLFVLHGLFGAGQNWRSVGRSLQRALPQLSVVLVDLPDHGSSPHSAVPLSYPLLADACARLLDQPRFQPCPRLALGHSMGGKVAMWMALTRPQLFDRLVVVDVAPVDYPVAGDHASFVHLAHCLLRVDTVGRSRHAIADQLAADIPDLGLRQFLMTNLVATPGSSRPNDWHWRCNLPNLIASFEAIKAFPATDSPAVKPYTRPTLFIRGERSHYVLPQHRPVIDALFPNSQSVTIPAAGHWPHFGPTAQQFTDALANWLSQECTHLQQK